MSVNEQFKLDGLAGEAALARRENGGDARVRLLVVDDDEAIRNLLSAVFLAEGYAVRTAVGSRDAIGVCGAEAFDVVLSDVRLDGENGHDLARWLAANRPGVRWALMTGFNDDCPVCPLANRCRIVRKPFRLDEVLGAVRSLLAG